jgi:hypothetical protein
MPLELGRPTALWLLTLLVPLVLLYVLRVRRERRRVGSVWLWQAAQRDLLAQHPFRRLVAQVPLILQALALVVLVLSLSDPATRGGELAADHVAIVVDTSASMAAREPAGKTRIELARAAAEGIVQRLRPGAKVMLVEAGREPRIASGFDRDARRLSGAIARLNAQDVEGTLAAAIALSADRLRAQPGLRRLFVISDAAGPDPGLAGTADVSLEVVRVGSDLDNAAIVRVDVRRGVNASRRVDEVQVFALAANFGRKPRDVFVTLRQRGVTEPLASRKLRLAPDERAPVVLTFEPAPSDAGSGLVVELTPGDALATDDSAYGRVPPSRKLPVVIAPKGGSPWLKRAILADADVELLELELPALASDPFAVDALVVVDGSCPSGLPGSGVLVADPPLGTCRTLRVEREVNGVAISTWNDADPRLRFLSLDGVVVQNARVLSVDSARDELVRAREGALIANASLPGQAGTVIGFDVGQSNWPLKASFVLFVRNVMELAREHRARGIIGAAQTGDNIRIRVPLDVTRVEIESPDGSRTHATAHAGLAVLPQAHQAGFYFANWSGLRAGSALVPANLTSEEESHLRPRAWRESESANAARVSRTGPSSFSRWGWVFAAVGLLAIAADAWWLTRRSVRRSGART